MKKLQLFVTCLFALFLASCSQETLPTERPVSPTGAVSPTVTHTLTPTATLIPPTITLSPTSSQTPVPTLTPTPDPYWLYTMDYLSSREYGAGTLEIVETLAENTYFTRYLIRYPSDGLTIYGFLNVPVNGGPAGEGPFPFVIALHGYIEPEVYGTLDYTTGYADALARAGYIVLHPNLRGYPPSDEGENLFRVGMAIDVLNLIGIVVHHDWAGTPLENGDPAHLGLWGHSMGGGISTRVMLVSPEVDAVVLYAAMSGDERKNWEAINGWSFSVRGVDELAFPVEELDRVSPMYFFDRLTAEVSIHHGRVDELVPLNWSITTCDALTALGKKVECWYYEQMTHTFYGEGDQLFITRTVQFFDRVLKIP